MTKRVIVVMMAVVLCAAMAAPAQDTFGTGANQFTIDFVTISGDASSANGTVIGSFDEPFSDPGNNYRMGTFEITNGQYAKFVAELGVPVTGSDGGYDRSPYFTGTNVPTNMVSWYEAAQFVNWLNTSTGHQAAYKFTGTQGTSSYTLETWSAGEADGGTNLLRHKDAFYYLPTEDEWVKAAHWNGTGLQTYATKDGSLPVAGVDSNYSHAVGQPWDVGSGSEELNGTFDMMGNVWEWMENTFYSDDVSGTGNRTRRGGSYFYFEGGFALSYRTDYAPYYEVNDFGFRVASVPEPCSSGLLSLGGLALLRPRK